MQRGPRRDSIHTVIFVTITNYHLTLLTCMDKTLLYEYNLAFLCEIYLRALSNSLFTLSLSFTGLPSSSPPLWHYSTTGLRKGGREAYLLSVLFLPFKTEKKRGRGALQKANGGDSHLLLYHVQQ